ncbi:predicted signal transduction protein [Vibrio maritimus]|uniref:Predicted signal transduction protein n=1 Tax=Vibrio maritimus TaxID=990268 RepID=A0A090SLU4_9VIBR|nr:predicted signal transduction protein [Vibrio maritimus]
MNASYLIRSEIKSFKQALVYLGEERLRKFISLVAITSTQDDKPDSLYSLSIQRARFCELLLKDINSNIDEGLGFLTGMFSLLDSLFDQPLEELVEKMPIDNMVKAALVTKQGTLGNILSLVKAYESADWTTVIALRDKLEISDDKLARYYDDAIKWTEDLLAIESEYNTHL